MGPRAPLLLLLLLCSATANGYHHRYGEEEGEEREVEGFVEGGGEGRGQFMLERPREVVKTEAGVVRVAMGYRHKGCPSAMHVGFITMEPKSLFLPQYMDANLIIFVRRGEVRVGMIYDDELVVRDLKMGDVYRIPAGSAFYLANTGEGKTLHIVASIDASESFDVAVPFQSFFIGGGIYPTSVLSGFDIHTLTAAFNVTAEDLGAMMGKQSGGPIVYMSGDAAEDAPEKLNSVVKLLMQRRKGVAVGDEDDGEDVYETKSPRGESKTGAWTWRKLLDTMLGLEEEEREEENLGKKKDGGPDPYNLYKKKPDFKNEYGWSVALDEHEYHPLKHSGIGIYLVNLTAGSMMAPHMNPVATEYGVVLSGSGTIQVVFPNGSSAMSAEVGEGDAFWVPHYFPFCQVASVAGPMEFFGFTTSARRNRPQFLVGRASVLRSLRGAELAAAFGVSEEELDRLVDSQRESLIMPARRRGGSGGGREREEAAGKGRRETGREGGGEARAPHIRKVGS